ncbi:unnamed protein product [Phaedon cochleariae]|uniref:Double jelly roll-like domain-containing protein n=1 Tax=Phaedon cochleariae TaxID=80249 RepID=A0A9N9SFL2_PHACE|nr:unnamed protein product [Phaedon cochleariae]
MRYKSNPKSTILIKNHQQKNKFPPIRQTTSVGSIYSAIGKHQTVKHRQQQIRDGTVLLVYLDVRAVLVSRLVNQTVEAPGKLVSQEAWRCVRSGASTSNKYYGFSCRKGADKQVEARGFVQVNNPSKEAYNSNSKHGCGDEMTSTLFAEWSVQFGVSTAHGSQGYGSGYKVVERANTALQGSPQTQSIAKITIESINLKVPHLTPNDDIKLQLLTRIKADESMMIPFRRWELHELPALTQGSTIEIWSVKTCSALDSPRYVIVFFQTKKADNLHEDVTLFDNANIKSIRLALNSDYYPQERMLLDFSRDQYADAHFNYTEFNKSYHNCQEKRSLVNFAEFKSRPMFVIDCSRRHLGLKSSTVDIKNLNAQDEERDGLFISDDLKRNLEFCGKGEGCLTLEKRKDVG